MSKAVLVQANKEFILVSSYLVRALSIIDPEQELIFLPRDVDSVSLGEMVKKRLEQSREIEFDEFQKIFYSEKHQSSDSIFEGILKEKYGYKSRKAMYKDMDFVTIQILSEDIKISPSHQDSLTGFTALKNDIEFILEPSISSEELGEKVKEAFTYCTSKYRK